MGNPKYNYDVFISYRRDGGADTARIIQERLTDKGYKVFFDVETLRSGDFNKDLYNVIEGADDFVLILSKGALDRCQNEGDWVRNEIEHALRNGKNIIPVMLRGFVFPETMPESIEPLRYKNGIEASTEFFDAFIEKLAGFISAKPAFANRLLQNVVFRRTWPFMAALSLTAMLILGGLFAYRQLIDNSGGGVFPSTRAEINLVNEVASYITRSMAVFDTAQYRYVTALNAYGAYLSNGSDTERRNAVNEIGSAENLLAWLDLSSVTLSPIAAESLHDSPFLVSDIFLLQPAIMMSISDTAQNLENMIRYMESGLFDAPIQRQLLEIMRRLNNALLLNAVHVANGIMMPVYHNSAEYRDLRNTLMGLTNLPFETYIWRTDIAELMTVMDANQTRMAEAIHEWALLVGDWNMLLNEEQRAYDEMQAALEQLRADARINSMPRATDSTETLWTKAQYFISLDMPNEAALSLNMYLTNERGNDPNSETYVPAAIAFARAKAAGQIDRYGLLVFGFATAETGYNPDYRHPYLNVGDFILQIDGQNTTTAAELRNVRNRDARQIYTVLRLNADGGFDVIEIEVPEGVMMLLGTIEMVY
jgi:hypothetical protein